MKVQSYRREVSWVNYAKAARDVQLSTKAFGKLYPHCKLVLLYLAMRVDKFGKCFPSYDTIQADCGLGRSTIKKVLTILQAERLLTYVKGGGNQYKAASNRYTLSLETMQKHATKAESAESPAEVAESPAEVAESPNHVAESPTMSATPWMETVSIQSYKVPDMKTPDRSKVDLLSNKEGGPTGINAGTAPESTTPTLETYRNLPEWKDEYWPKTNGDPRPHIRFMGITFQLPKDYRPGDWKQWVVNRHEHEQPFLKNGFFWLAYVDEQKRMGQLMKVTENEGKWDFTAIGQGFMETARTKSAAA